MIIPVNLKEGDTIGIVSPAGKVNADYVVKATKTLENWGYKVVVGKNCMMSHYQYAGSDEERLSDFQKMLDAEYIRAIICSRGGYGSIRLLHRLDFSKFMENPKWIVGFSDITVFHSALHNLNVCSVHGPMTKHLAENPDSESAIKLNEILKLGTTNYIISGHRLNKRGSCKGKIIGGNLAILTSLIGTDYDFNPDGKILFIEDIGEYLYRIDRMMWQLKLAGKLKSLAGLIIGQFSDLKDNDSPFGKNAYEIISEHINQYTYPVCFGFPAGHEDINLPLLLNSEIVLEIQDTVQMKYINPEK